MKSEARVEITAAIVDRLTFNGTIETGSQSYRLAHAKNRQGTPSG